MLYIFTPYQAALDARLITELTTRRVNNDRTTVILHEQDYDKYTPMILIKEDGSEAETERYTNNLKEKTDLLGGIIMTRDEALKEITKEEWQGKEE